MSWRVTSAAVGVGIALVVSGCGCTDDDSGAAAVFSFATDDLCEWVSEAEVAEFVAAEFDSARLK